MILRWHLRKIDAMSRRYAHFLDYTAERILLRRMGGGYRLLIASGWIISFSWRKIHPGTEDAV